MASLGTVEKDILRLLSEKVDADLTLTPETNIVADTGLASVDVMDFVFELEDEFGISVPLDRISDTNTVKQLAVAIHSLIEAEA